MAGAGAVLKPTVRVMGLIVVLEDADVSLALRSVALTLTVYVPLTT